MKPTPTSDLFEEILASIEEEGAMSQKTRDSLILRGIISLYNEIEGINKEILELKKIVPLYKILVLIGTSILGLVITLLWGIITGQIKIVF